QVSVSHSKKRGMEETRPRAGEVGRELLTVVLDARVETRRRVEEPSELGAGVGGRGGGDRGQLESSEESLFDGAETAEHLCGLRVHGVELGPGVADEIQEHQEIDLLQPGLRVGGTATGAT